MVLSRISKWKDPAPADINNTYDAPKNMLPEFIKRIDALHKLVLEAYPQGVGTDPWWKRFVRPPVDPKLPITFTYKSGFPFYYCS